MKSEAAEAKREEARNLGNGGEKKVMVFVFIYVASYYVLMQHPWDLAILKARPFE